MLSSQLSQILKANIATLNSLYNFFTYKDACIKEQYLSCCKSVIGLLLVFLLFELYQYVSQQTIQVTVRV